MKTHPYKNFLALGAISILAAGLCGAAPAAKRPNILFIIADDASFEQLTQQGDLRMTGKGDWYDSAENPYGIEGERNFYQRVNNGENFKNRSAAYVRPDLEDGM